MLDDDDILLLARWAVLIERHYGRPMDIEWARDGVTDELFVVQARPETVQARRSTATFVHYTVRDAGEVLVRGLSVGDAAAVGPVCVLSGPDEIERSPTAACWWRRSPTPIGSRPCAGPPPWSPTAAAARRMRPS